MLTPRSTRDSFHEELQCQYLYESSAQKMKDILIVVHDQLDYTKKCIQSLYQYTSNFKLYIWDNASAPETRDYLQSLENIILIRSEENLGFIIPNNRLAEKTTSPYIILLNSDTEVQLGWDTALLGYLESHPDVGITGYCGGILAENGYAKLLGIPGSEIDYISGWCMAIPRRIYEELGLFDEKLLEFAYFEDSDFSLRVKEAGYQIYALHLELVFHYQNATIKQVEKERDTVTPGRKNQQNFRQKWQNYLTTGVKT